MNQHDLKNHLFAIRGSLTLALRQLKDPSSRAYTLVNNAMKATSDLEVELMESLYPASEKAEHPRQADDHDHTVIPDGGNQSDLFFAAIEMTRMPMIVTNPNLPDNPIIFANQAFLQTSGYNKEEMLGKNCRFLQGPGTDPRAIDDIRRAIAERTDLSVEVLNYRKDGSTFWNALYISPIFSPTGKLLYFFGSQLDVTRRHDAEVALRQTQKLEAIGQLTGGIAHDFNNLLQIVLGNLQLAQMTGDDGKIHHYIDLAIQASTRARILTQQLLAFSRKQALEMRIVNLNRTITDLLPLVSGTLGDTIELETRLNAKVGNIRIDTVHLEMAIINILANARDAMPHGGSVIVSTSLHQQKQSLNAGDMPVGEYICLSLRDTGEGMSPEVLAHVTEPFFTTKEVGKGTGLGLAQVHGFVKQSNGHVRIESEPGVGSTIRMYFPVAEGSRDIERAAMPKGNTGRGEHVLVVEDNQEVQDLAVNILELEGYTVTRANTAVEALNMIKSGQPIDLVFTDIIMPGSMNGVSLAKEIRRLRSTTAVLLTTGFSDDTNSQSLHGSFEVIYKPYMPRDLAEKIRSTLNTRKNHGN